MPGWARQTGRTWCSPQARGSADRRDGAGSGMEGTGRTSRCQMLKIGGLGALAVAGLGAAAGTATWWAARRWGVSTSIGDQASTGWWTSRSSPSTAARDRHPPSARGAAGGGPLRRGRPPRRTCRGPGRGALPADGLPAPVAGRGRRGGVDRGTRALDRDRGRDRYGDGVAPPALAPDPCAGRRRAGVGRLVRRRGRAGVTTLVPPAFGLFKRESRTIMSGPDGPPTSGAAARDRHGGSVAKASRAAGSESADR